MIMIGSLMPTMHLNWSSDLPAHTSCLLEKNMRLQDLMTTGKASRMILQVWYWQTFFVIGNVKNNDTNIAQIVNCHAKPIPVVMFEDLVWVGFLWWEARPGYLRTVSNILSGLLKETYPSWDLSFGTRAWVKKPKLHPNKARTEPWWCIV